MAARVLLALPDGSGALADALRAAGHVLETCSPGRLRAAAAAFRPAVCLVQLGSDELTAVQLELLGSTGAPALVGLLERTGGSVAHRALEQGAAAVLPGDASAAWVCAAVRAAAWAHAAALELAGRREAQQKADTLLLAGSSAAARGLREGLERVASTPRTTVLVLAPPGEEGPAVARLVHARSGRQAGPLAELRPGTQPDVDEAEALDPGGGLLARSEGGTLVVAEVGRLGPLAQLALVRVLDQRSGEGGGPDVRIVATTSLELEREVQAGRFREELLYRLNVLTLPVPSLDERAEDLGELARALLERAVGPARPAPRLAPDTIEELRRRKWSGGLGQLRLVLEAALRACETPILGPALLPPASLAAPAGSGPIPPEEPTSPLGDPGLMLRLPDRSLRSAEEALIRQVLAETGGNKLRSAEILGIHRATLYHKLRDYGIDS